MAFEPAAEQHAQQVLTGLLYFVPIILLTSAMQELACMQIAATHCCFGQIRHALQHKCNAMILRCLLMA